MMATQDKDFNILIADDDRECRQALRDIMEPEGFHTLLASCGEEAIDLIRVPWSIWCCSTCTCRR